MTFEGQTKVLPIKGIERAGADNLCEDGAMNEVVGLEYKDGSYVPYAGVERQTILSRKNRFQEHLTIFYGGGAHLYYRKKEMDGANSLCWEYTNGSSVSYVYSSGLNPSNVPPVYSDENCTQIAFSSNVTYFNYDIKKILVHKTNVQNNIIILTSTGYLFWVKETDFYSTTSEDNAIHQISLLFNVSEIEFIGNVICADNLNSIIWSQVDNNYLQYGSNNYGDTDKSSYYDLPRLQFRVTSNGGEQMVYSSFSGEDTIYSAGGTAGTVWIFDNFKQNAAALYFLARDNVRKKGRLCGFVLVAYAYELRTGGYILASNPMLMCAPAFGLNNCMGIFGYGNTSGIGTGVLIPRAVISDFTQGQHVNFISPVSDQWGTPSVGEAGYFNGNVVRVGSNVSLLQEGIYCNAPAYFSFAGKNYSVDTPVMGGIMQSNQLQFQIDKDIQEKYKDLIRGINIFISEPIYPFGNSTDEIRNRGTFVQIDQTNGGSYKLFGAEFTPKTVAEIRNEILNLKLLYKVQEIHYDEIKNSNSVWQNANLKGKLGDVLYTQETLPLSAFVHNHIVNGKLSTYNNRLHLFDYYQTIFNGYNPIMFLNRDGYGQEDTPPSSGTMTTFTKTTIKSMEYGGCVVWRTVNEHSALHKIGPFIVYPDSGAVSIDFYSHYVDSNIDKWYHTHIQLTSKENMGIAYYMSSNLKTIDLLQGEEVSEPEVEDFNNLVNYKNGLRVSDSNNPNYFPIEYTYRIGKANICQLKSLTIPLSQDTFGTYPMVALCGDGIYALGVNADGTGVYRQIIPFSPEVCINPNTVCAIGGAIFFASDKGLMIATSEGVSAFNLVLNGEPKHLPIDDKSRGNGMLYYGKIISTQGATQLWDNPTRDASGSITAYNDKAISRQDFIKYLQDNNTVVSYVSTKNKLIVYNKTKEFIYWIDIPSRNATKLYTKINVDNNDFPTEKYYLLTTNEKKEITFKYLSANTNTDAMFQTRPIKIARGLKGTFRVVLRGYFINDEVYQVNNEDKKYFAELFILGSLDCTNWQVIGKKEKCLHGGFHDFGCETDRVSYNYLMICFSGRLQPDKEVNGMSDNTEGSHIDSIEITLESRDDNKR